MIGYRIRTTAVTLAISAFLFLTGHIIHAATDDFQSYTAGTNNLVGQAAFLGFGNWVDMEGDSGRLPSVGSLSISASNGFTGQAVKNSDNVAHRSAAFDVGSALTVGDAVSVYLQFDSASQGPEAHLYVGNDTLVNATPNDEVAFMLRMDSSSSSYNLTADTFEGDGSEIAGSVGAGTRVKNLASFGDWYEVRINITGTGGNGITDADADYRNVTAGESFYTPLGSFASFPTGFGNGNTFVGLGTFSDGGNFDNLSTGSPTVGSGPTDFTWTLDILGDWSEPGNWDPPGGGPPNDQNHTAIFTSTQTSVVVLTSPVTVNRIEFDNAEGSYAIAGLSSVNLFANTAATPVLPTIDVAAGTHEFQAAVNLNESTLVTMASGAKLTFNNALNLGGFTLTKTGDGTIAINNQLTTAGGALDIQQGTVEGVGIVGGDVNNEGGTISPGNSVASASSVPEPTSLMLVAIGMISLICISRGQP